MKMKFHRTFGDFQKPRYFLVRKTFRYQRSYLMLAPCQRLEFHRVSHLIALFKAQLARKLTHRRAVRNTVWIIYTRP